MKYKELRDLLSAEQEKNKELEAKIKEREDKINTLYSNINLLIKENIKMLPTEIIKEQLENTGNVKDVFD